MASSVTAKQRVFDIIRNWSRYLVERSSLPKVLFILVSDYYGKGDIMIIFMDRLEIYNLISPNSINLNPPIAINNNSILPNANKFTFRCSVVNREHSTNDICFIGGFDEVHGTATNECQIYSINDNKLYAISPCNTRRSDAQSVMLNKNELITLGGHQVQAIDSCELYSFKEVS